MFSGGISDRAPPGTMPNPSTSTSPARAEAGAVPSSPSLTPCGHMAHLIDFRHYFAAEMEQMREMQQQGLVSISDSSIQVTYFD